MAAIQRRRAAAARTDRRENTRMDSDFYCHILSLPPPSVSYRQTEIQTSRRRPALFVPFTVTVDLKSFHVIGDIALETSNFEGDATRAGQIHFSGKNTIVW